MLMRFFHGAGDVHHRQEHKDERLDQGYEYFQKQNRQRDDEGNQQKQNGYNDMSTLDVSE